MRDRMSWGLGLGLLALVLGSGCAATIDDEYAGTWVGLMTCTGEIQHPGADAESVELIDDQYAVTIGAAMEGDEVVRWWDAWGCRYTIEVGPEYEDVPRHSPIIGTDDCDGSRGEGARVIRSRLWHGEERLTLSMSQIYQGQREGVPVWLDCQFEGDLVR